MSLPPTEIPLGAVRFNSDSQKLEYWIGDAWMQVQTFSPNLDGGERGIIGSGYSIPGGSGANNIDFVTIPTQGNATDFGDLTYGNAYRGGLASNTRGIFINGQNDQSTDFITISSTGNATSFGEITNDNFGGATFSNQIKGFRAGGADGPAHTNEIIGMTIATTSSFFDFGDMSVTGIYMNGCGNPTRGIMMGGASPSPVGDINTIQYLSMGSSGNAQDFGDLSLTRKYISCLSNSVRAVAAGGGGDDATRDTMMEFIQIATTGNATDFGDCSDTNGTNSSGNCASPTRGLFAGFYPAPAQIEYIAFATQGDSVDFGDLNYHGYYCGATSNGHGGLG